MLRIEKVLTIQLLVVAVPETVSGFSIQYIGSCIIPKLIDNQVMHMQGTYVFVKCNV